MGKVFLVWHSLELEFLLGSLSSDLCFHPGLDELHHMQEAIQGDYDSHGNCHGYQGVDEQ